MACYKNMVDVANLLKFPSKYSTPDSHPKKKKKSIQHPLAKREENHHPS